MRGIIRRFKMGETICKVPKKKAKIKWEKCDYCEKNLNRRNGDLYNYCLECLNIIENRGYNQALKDVMKILRKYEKKDSYFEESLQNEIKSLRKK